jgi:hypothetical protein
MDGSQLFEVWAPEDSLWSRWAKPALFAAPLASFPTETANPANLMPVHSIEPRPAYDQGALDPWTAFLVDMPGERSVEIGMALARTGYRPVPLFNTAYHQSAIVPVYPLLKRLRDAADELQGLAIPPDAPPVFLLDSKRLDPSTPPGPGKFDNRWMVFPQDFPSANFLLSRNLRRVVLLLQEDRLQGRPDFDLAHVLLRW